MWPRHSRAKKNHWMITGFYMDLKPPTALRAAVSAGHGHVVRLLLRPEHRLQPLTSVEYLRAVLAATEAGRMDLAIAVLNAIRRRVDDFPGLREEMLCAAVRHDRLPFARKLLVQRANVNVRTDRDYSSHLPALHLAARRGTPDEGPPLYERENPGPWLARHLISLGAQTTEDKYRNSKEKGKRFIRDVHVTERTWEWVSKF
ncbi:FAD/NAD(P)-binding domain-containing protein [Apiospora arundinis]